ncbi:MAG TPA: DUF5683 domain-containing protein [Ferruginibacter sp.]|nr:DUF5683 domain-containing protein [Ferruginibacter sp.]HRO17922.1 DUF5683 domain-containing protein [Ferruginibacter sp.]HRQ21062.1 DUF5683 domain-containing protein [Ferruginibacter sp.]
MKKWLTILCCMLMPAVLLAQGDTVVQTAPHPAIKEGSLAVQKPTVYNPKIAIRRSAILPGWGQATNKKYWKIPLVYGALGTTSYLFFRNLKQYRESKDAYILATDGDETNDYLIKEPYYTVRYQPDRIRNFRNQVRQNVDYSALFFLIFWGLNVVDAAVDAHLKTFDVSDDLSLHIKPGFSPTANTTGISLVLQIGK